MKNYRSKALEMIAHQTDGYAEKLVAAFAELLKINNRADAQKSAACKTIIDLTSKRFKMNLNFLVDTEYPPCCFPIMANMSHVLSSFQLPVIINDSFDAFNAVVKDPGKFKGTIDLKNATLGGDYSKVEMVVHMDHYFTLGTFNAREAAAVFLHEIGHCFLGLEFTYRTARVSQLLGTLHQAKTNRTQDMTYTHLVDICAKRLASEGLISTPKELENVVALKSHEATVTYTYSTVWRKLGSDFGSHAQTGPNFEALADNFAVRFGLGDAIVTGLSKLLPGQNEGLAASLTYVASTVMPVAFTGMLLLSFGAPLVIAAAVASAFGLLLICCGGHSDLGFQQTNVYNTTINRYKRIRVGVIDALKDRNISQKARDEMLRQVAVIDKIVAGKTDVGNLYETLANLVFSYRRDAKNAFELERNLEALTSNNLFLGASALKSAA